MERRRNGVERGGGINPKAKVKGGMEAKEREE